MIDAEVVGSDPPARRAVCDRARLVERRLEAVAICRAEIESSHRPDGRDHDLGSEWERTNHHPRRQRRREVARDARRELVLAFELQVRAELRQGQQREVHHQDQRDHLHVPDHRHRQQHAAVRRRQPVHRRLRCNDIRGAADALVRDRNDASFSSITTGSTFMPPNPIFCSPQCGAGIMWRCTSRGCSTACSTR